MAQTNWRAMRVAIAFRFSMFLNKRPLSIQALTDFDYND